MLYNLFLLSILIGTSYSIASEKINMDEKLDAGHQTSRSNSLSRNSTASNEVENLEYAPLNYSQRFFNGLLLPEQEKNIEHQQILSDLLASLYSQGKNGSYCINTTSESILLDLNTKGIINLDYDKKSFRRVELEFYKDIIVNFSIIDQSQLINYFQEFYKNQKEYLANLKNEDCF